MVALSVLFLLASPHLSLPQFAVPGPKLPQLPDSSFSTGRGAPGNPVFGEERLLPKEVVDKLERQGKQNHRKVVNTRTLRCVMFNDYLSSASVTNAGSSAMAANWRAQQQRAVTIVKRLKRQQNC